ncbi:MAG: acylneuraminate cytidylyltransferase family protein [Candidatus Anstonellales archaeon]
MRIVGIIPARGGSKGLPRKNILPLGGKPLLSYTIEAALQSRIDRTIVSTEDVEIAEIAKKIGAEVPFLRPKKLATDTASSLSVILHALNYLDKNKYHSDVIVFLQPTSPFRTHKHINAALELLLDSDVDSVISVCEAEYHPYWMFWKESDDALREFIKIKDKPLRRQDLPTLYRINDAIVISRRSYFDKVKENSPCFNPRSVKGYVMDRVSSIDINDKFDFLLAEFIIKSGLFKG